MIPLQKKLAFLNELYLAQLSSTEYLQGLTPLYGRENLNEDLYLLMHRSRFKIHDGDDLGSQLAILKRNYLALRKGLVF